ncbi:MAG TPA: TDP-N-acetylfucosamine:lipid II N-acetylfucosaminyltransferase [Paludibacter sp.]|mgnify:CR=1 FL=1|nr:TDP-N-acetylfucosamine:lipid II N-acetylfucosaminyltransferase [Paludibacter sp.]
MGSGIKILHFAPDEKFIPLQQELFEEAFPGANAWRIQATPGKPFRHGISHTSTKQVMPSYFRSRALKKESEEFDLLVVHCMNRNHAAGVKTVRPGICVCWFGWGVDYYHLLSDQLEGLFLDKTKILHQCLAKTNNFKTRIISLNRTKIIDYIKIFLPYILSKLRLIQEDSIETVADRIDVYRILEVEVEMVRKAIPKLRAAFCLHYYYTTEDVYAKGPNEMTGPHILLGNSSSSTNNHIEALDLLQGIVKDERKIIVPLNYGDQSYADEICKIGYKCLGNSFQPLRIWMPIEEYHQKISQCGFVIMNHKRQQAFGNINAALYKGAKVFLRPENPLYKFYLSMGIQICAVEELEKHGDQALKPLDAATRDNNRSIIGDYMSRKRTIQHIRNLEQFVIKKRMKQGAHTTA